MSKIGNRIFMEFDRPAPEIVERFRGLPSSNINDEMNRLFCMHSYMKLLNPNSAAPSMVGTAITVKAPIGDNLFFHQALDMAQPGDIIVVDGATGNNRSLAGEIMLRFAQSKGIAGVVADGCLRDLDGIEKLSMPVYAAGITPQGPWKFGPGEVNTPIACGGQVVFPGDILVGDRDGIVVIHRQDAEAVAAAAIAKKEKEDQTFQLMDTDLAAYTEKHKNNTEKRFQGHEPEIIEDSFTSLYGL
jgi:regulator of RNase E activity RraA